MRIIARQQINDELTELMRQYGEERSALLPILHAMQDKYGFLSGLILQETAHALGIHPAEVEGVASFYSFFETDKRLGKYVIRLCQTISCNLAGKAQVARQLENELGIRFGETTNDGMFTLKYTNCLGMCDQGPALLINDRLFAKVTPNLVHQILRDCRRDFVKSVFPQVVPSDVRQSGPLLEHGIKDGAALEAALKNTPGQIIELIENAKLKGRGGAGFPTALKWKLAMDKVSDTKYVVCNADEGEPGTFKDRYLLYNHVGIIFDGMTIAGYTIGARKAYIYLRAEYRYMLRYLESEIKARRERGLLGEDILGKKGFDFDIEIRLGAGSYVCGEETALIESLEGQRGESRNRPPFPVDTGFFGNPTIVNNVETFAAAAMICARGDVWFRKHGTEISTGTKLFSISGNCERPGIYELPFGISVNEMLRTVGGEDAKAVQIGGAAGQCLARHEFDQAIAYEGVPSGGSIIVFGPDTDMLNVARNFSEFFVEECCGQCTPCRVGNVKILEGIRLLEEGRCSILYLDELVKLSRTLRNISKCGAGQSSGNAFTTIMEHFKDEILGRVHTVAGEN